MKSTGILVKTSALILGFTLVLGVGILSLSFSHGGARRNEDTFLTPEHAIAAPTAQELLQKKFDAYNTVTKEDGKRIVTIFSEEQITDIRTRRENGEWFWLSGEEMLYLINDTVKLFETYDVVKVRDLEGNLKAFDCATSGITKDNALINAIFLRVNPLNCAFAMDNTRVYSFYTDLKNPLSQEELQQLHNLRNPWFSSGCEETAIFRWDFMNGDEYVHIHFTKFSLEVSEYLNLSEHKTILPVQ